jgi:hypothetical protein
MDIECKGVCRAFWVSHMVYRAIHDVYDDGAMRQYTSHTCDAMEAIS